MPAIDLHAPVLGPSGQPCPACGAPLAADQRYCLSCGERRGPPRLDPLAYARGGGSEIAAAQPAPAARARRATGWPLPSPRVAGIATLLVLGFGIAAGAAAGPRADATLASAARPPVIVLAPPPAPRPPRSPPRHPRRHSPRR